MTIDFRHHHAEIDGLSLHWAEAGQATQHTPVVLLHGLTDSHLTWRPVAEQLARERLVLMPDLPGCGLSDRPDASYELQWHAGVIARWIEQRELEAVDVVGHSFGGGVAQMLLLECRPRVRRMVLSASGGLGQDLGFWLRLAAFPHFVERYGQPFMAFGTRRALNHLATERDRRDVDALAAMNARHGTARAFSRTVRDVIGFSGQRRLFWQRAHEVETFPPIAVLWGARDKCIPSTHGHGFAERMAGVRLKVFDDCGHYLHREKPTDFADAVREFLDDPAVPPARWTAPASAQDATERAA